MKRLAVALFLVAATAQAAIHGTLIDEQGKPVHGATVRAYPAEETRAWRMRIMRGVELAPITTTKSDESGAFSLEAKTALAALDIEADGKVPLLIEAPDGDNLEVIVLHDGPKQKLHLVEGGKPVANATIAAGPLLLHSSSEGTVEIPEPSRGFAVHPDHVPAEFSSSSTDEPDEVPMRRGSVVRGRVIDSDGKPVANATISIWCWPLAQSAADGTFAIPHAPASWRTLVATDGTRIGSAVNARAKSYEIKLQPAGSIGGTTAAAARVFVTPESDPESAGFVIANGEGKFDSGALLPGSYRLTTYRRGYASTSASLTIKPGEHATRSMTAKPATRVRGRILDEEHQPVAGAIVWCGSAMPLDGLAVSGKDGSFDAARVTTPQPHGMYFQQPQQAIYAVKAGYALGTSGPVAEGKTNIAITLPRGFPLQVHLLDRARQTVAGAYVTMTRGSEMSFPAARDVVVCEVPLSHDCRTTGNDGLANFRATDGTYELRVSGPLIVTRSLPQTITAKSSPLTIEVDRGTEVSGSVTYRDGTPVAGARITTRPMGVATAVSDDDGTFILRNLPPGKIALAASLNNQQLQTDAVDITAPARGVVLTMPALARIEGRVFDKESSQPVTDFQVAVRPGPGRLGYYGPGSSIHSDDGSFVIDPVAIAPIQLEITASGRAPASRSDLQMEEGKTTRVEIPLERGGLVRGHITAGGQPVSGVAVRSNIVSATSDDGGDYVIDGVSTGSQVFGFFKEGFVQARKNVDVAAGKDTRLDVELDRGRELSGHVLDTSGHPIAGARVSLMAATGGFGGFPPVTADTDGSFTLTALPDGRYTLQAMKEGYVTARINDVAVPAQSPMTVTLGSGGTISGRVLGLSDAELAQTQVIASGSGTFTSGRANADGSFVLTGVPDGHLSIFAMVRGAAQRQSAPKSIDVVNGSGPSVDLNFNEGSTVSGRVTRGGVPVAFGNVMFSGSGGTRNSQISQEGRYEVGGLAAGDYTVRVYSAGISFQSKDSVAGDSTFDIQITGGTLRGRVIDSSTGAPVADASVWVEGTSQNMTRVQSGTDSDGHFMLDAVPDGSYVLHATSRQHYAPASQAITVTDGAAPDVELHLDPAQPTAFRITDGQSGAPMDAYISVLDGKTQIAFAAGPRDDDGAIRIYLAPGQYHASVNWRGYVTQSVDFSAPGPDVRVALQMGGRVVMIAAKPTHVRLNLPAASPSASGGVITGAIDGFASPTGWTFENARPGNGSIDILADDGKTVTKSISVTIVGGQTVTVNVD